MKIYSTTRSRFVLPLPGFVLHPITALIIAAVHVYLAAGHLSSLIGGDIEWTHLWKGFGALGGVYVFAALASRGFAQRSRQDFYPGAVRHGQETRLDSQHS